MELDEKLAAVITIDNNDLPATTTAESSNTPVTDTTATVVNSNNNLGIDIEIDSVTNDLKMLSVNEKLLSEPFYPSPGIEVLFADATLVSLNKMAQTVFDNKYKVETEFTQIETVNFLVDFYKINRISLTTTKELLIPLLKELTEICEANQFDVIKCTNFLRWLEFRRQKQHHTFIAYTKKLANVEQKKGYFDLDEHPDQYKRKTILECGSCKKTGELQKCAKCGTAAYCTRDCQVKDWSFHKKYCKAQEGYVEKCNKK